MILYSPEIDELIFLLGCENDGEICKWRWAIPPGMLPSSGHDDILYRHDWQFVGYL